MDHAEFDCKNAWYDCSYEMRYIKAIMIPCLHKQNTNAHKGKVLGTNALLYAP